MNHVAHGRSAHCDATEIVILVKDELSKTEDNFVVQQRRIKDTIMICYSVNFNQSSSNFLKETVCKRYMMILRDHKLENSKYLQSANID